MSRPDPTTVARARKEEEGYLAHCYADRDAGFPGRWGAGLDAAKAHIAKLEAIIAGLDALGQVERLNTENNRLRRQLADLVPWARALANSACVSGVDLDYRFWPDGFDEDRDVRVSADALLARINAGEFGEVQPS